MTLSGTTVSTDAGVLNRQTSNAQVTSTIGSIAAAAGADAGVIADFDTDISGSSVAVNGNAARGSAIGNVGNNTLSASATTLSGGGTAVQGIASGVDTGTATATADFSLANSQVLESASASSTTVAATFGANLTFDESLSDSRVSVSSNTQFAEALGNSATNRVALAATGAGAAAGVDPTAALSSSQLGDADIDSTSRMTVFANAASDDSSIAINGNSNTALGVVNNAVNAVTVSAVTLDGAADRSDIAANSSATADYALNSLQRASGTTDSTATSSIYNLDRTDTTTVGTDNSVVTLNNNATTAEASANRVANQLSVSATDIGATAALNNSQGSSAAVNASATMSVGYALQTAGTGTAADASSIAVDGNSTMALGPW